ncbi:hypothetical protein AAVH_13289 [Aphelenchoides avenae]|nr:hypothetical protein AAVH_13289 [Aphelenchus avenae]
MGTRHPLPYIIASSVCSLMCEIMVGLARPAAYDAYIELTLFSFLIMLYANSAMFVFRFGQTVDSSFVRWMAHRRYGIGAAIAMVSTFSVGTLLPLNFLTISPDDVRSTARKTDAGLYEIIKSQPFFGMQLKQTGWLAVAVFFGATFLIASSVCIVGSALGCQYFVRFSSRHSHLSTRTLRLYRVLANVLVLDLALSVATILLPGTLSGIHSQRTF